MILLLFPHAHTSTRRNVSAWHRDKDYGNWNKNGPIFKLAVFIYLMKACHYLQVSSTIIGKHRHLSYPGFFLCDHGHFCAGAQEKAAKLLTGDHMRCQSEQRLQQMGQERAVFSDPALY
jgi:hypothetical protein